MFGEAYVIDLILSNGAKTTLKTLSTAQNLRIIVCGGDGTVQWVFSDIETLIDEGIFTIRPAVAILPLGTGNDLSRQFGWGHGFNRGLVSLLKKDVSSAPVAHLDRWNINIVNDIDSVNQPTAEYKLKMSNYFGIGLDAKVVNNFEGCRCLISEIYLHLSILTIYYF
jgi:diacylglycerol kinase (ATP)